MESAHHDINLSIEEFASKYGLKIDIKPAPDSSLQRAILACQDSKIPIVITLDEYDKLSLQQNLAKAKDGGPPELAFMRGLFTTLKTYPPDFLFVTGVLPVLLLELSGATNDIKVLTHQPEFADAIGIPEVSSFDLLKGLQVLSLFGSFLAMQAAIIQELRRLANYLYQSPEQAHMRDVFVQETGEFMRDFFNGFRFVRDQKSPTLYNTQMVMRFLAYLVKHGAEALETLQEAKKNDRYTYSYLTMELREGIDTHTQVRL